jgi:hypothetical protein
MKKAYYKLISIFRGFKPKLRTFEFADFPIKFREEDLELPLPKLRKLNPSYVLIRELSSRPEVAVKKLEDVRTMVKCRVMTFSYPVVLRNYPIRFAPEIREFNTPELALKLPPKILSVEAHEMSFSRTLRMYEEIVKVVPYVRKSNRKALFSVPVTKQPLDRNWFSRDQMKLIRERTAQQNNTGWANVQVFEIYDKFCPGLYSNVRQEPGSKNIECVLSLTTAGRAVDKSYYLVIGQKRDSRQPIKAIIDTADIKPE